MFIKSPYCCWVCLLLLLFAGQKVVAQESVPVNNRVLEPIRTSDKLVTDSTLVKTDSTTVKNDSIKSNDIDAPITATGRDSMVMIMEEQNLLYIYGQGVIHYKEMDLEGEYIEMDADSSLVYATFGLDSIGEEFGYPIFKEGNKQYEMKKARYNFKTKKMYISDVITQEGEGYMTAGTTKKMPDDDLFMRDGKYTTCDDHDHPHFYLNLTKAKIRKGKNVVTGPAFLVVEDVPLPIAIPFGFFPFSKDYASGVLMPTYGDEMTRGFSLRDFGYYFAINNNIDLATRAEVYTKGSWGINAQSRYKKNYKFSGNFEASYLVTITGDKDTKGLENSDYSQSKDIKLSWSHSQDQRANPFSSVTASVNFSTSSFNRNQLNSIYSGDYSQNTKSSNVTYTFKHPTLPLSINANASVNQISRDTTLSLTLPNLNISMSQIYPFKRKEQVGDQRWYEKIYLSYTGTIANSIANVKEYEFFQKNVIKDWRNGMKHNIPVSASFNLFKYITISPSVNYSESWYTNRIEYGYNYNKGQVVPLDTTYGFYRVYDYNASVSANTKLYGMYKPWALLGKWTKGVQIRHVLTPSVSFSGAPDFTDPKFGMYEKLTYINKITQEKVIEKYSPYKDQLWGAPSAGKSGSMNFSLENNLEAKVPVASSDSVTDRKISLIDNLGLGMSYNFLADSMNWSNLRASIRIKLFGKSTLSLQGEFDTYLYNEAGQRINQLRMKGGKGIGRFMGTSSGYSYALSNEVVKKWFKKGGDENGSGTNGSNAPTDPLEDNGVDSPGGTDDGGAQQQTPLRKSKKENTGEYDSDGYLLLNIPWTLNFNYSINMGYDRQRFDKVKREYPYKLSQTLGISGNISPTKAWNFSFSTSYDFDYKKFATMQCSITRQMHCWSMQASVIPVGPYQSYNFSIAVNSSLLQDLKYNQSSNYRDALNWGN
jgi:hypothetical protein